MDRQQFTKTDKRTSLHSRNAATLASRNRMEVTSINMGSTPISPSKRASGLTARQQSHKLCKHTSLHSRGAPIFAPAVIRLHNSLLHYAIGQELQANM
jgi:hypothetical protein